MIAPEFREAVVAVREASQDCGVAAVLVGALIMEFTAEIDESYPAYKRTNDADFAVCVESWEAFGRLRGALVAKNFDRHPKIEHRFTNGKVQVDLIPYGKPVERDGKIEWPESGFEMSVVGFKEVCAAATTEVREGLPEVPVISVPGFVLLKIMAFQDRYERKDPKYSNDAEHLRYWLENFASIVNGDERGVKFVLSRGWDIEAEYAGAALLGWEVRALAGREAAKMIDEFVRESFDEESPFVQTILKAGRGYVEKEEGEGFVADVRGRLAAFLKGYSEET